MSLASRAAAPALLCKNGVNEMVAGSFGTAVRRSDRGGLVVAGLDEPLSGEQPDRLQQPVPQPGPGALGHQQALVHKRPEQIRDIQHVGPSQAAGPGAGASAMAERAGCGQLGRTGAPCQDCSWWVSPARPPHPACDSHRTGRSTCLARWG